jgi:uncharacterized protein (TIGR02118 family)
MIRVSVLYPKSEGTTFDMDYYKTKHRDLCFQVLPDLKRMDVEQGLDGPYIAAGHLFFDNMEELQRSMGGPDAVKAQEDVRNYTNCEPAIQISQVIPVS